MAAIKLKAFLLFSVPCFLLSAMSLSALGKKDAEDVKYLDDKWILCVTSFDFSMLPPAHRITGEVLTRKLVDKMQAISYRLRLSPEYAYYESYAWQQAISSAAQAIANKRNERSQLLYRGDPDWRYRINIKKIDADLLVLEETFRQKEAERPLIDSEPVFSLHQNNIDGTYPNPPSPKGERRFCVSQKADAFLTGSIREFHGRYFIRLGLFVLYANAWVYEDDIIFSLEDIEESVDEIATRLTMVLSGNKPATVAITADPPESQILLNHNFAGRGTVEPRERPPGTVIIAVGADGFMSEVVETSLAPGELVEVDITLSPLQHTDVNIIAADSRSIPATPSVEGAPSAEGAPPGEDAPSTGIAVYHGALYVGEAPYHLRLPIDQLNYITIENSRGEEAKAVFTSPDMPSESMNLTFNLKRPPPGTRRVNRARGQYYWAWAGVWVTGITAWLTDGMYKTQFASLSDSSDSGFYDSAQRLYYIRNGALIALGAAIVNETFWMTRYIFTSTQKAVPIVKKDKQKK